jgi:hypothetical protein
VTDLGSANAPCYTLRVPFKLASGMCIDELESSTEWNICGVRVKLEYNNPFYVLKADGFSSEEAACQYFDRLWNGLEWLLLDRSVALMATKNLARITRADDPDQAAINLAQSLGIPHKGPIHGVIHTDQPSIYPTAQRFVFVGAMAPSIRGGIGLSGFFKALADGMVLRETPTTSDRGLRAAIDLYSASFHEQPASARFIMLIMALEVLTSRAVKHTVALRLLDRWRDDLLQERAKQKHDSDALEALDALERELLFRKVISLRGQIRILVRETLLAAGDPDASELARLAVRLYDDRSKLVHDGTLPSDTLAKSTDDARMLLVKVLKARFCAVGDE